MRVGIIGAGLQGSRRASALREFPGTELVVVGDADYDRAAALASSLGCESEGKWEAVATREDLDIVVVCTPPQPHAEITIAAVESGKHVLCEKPVARTEEEAHAMIEAARRSGRVLKCGFNHRHHPAIQQARQWSDQGAVGDLMFIRCRYGTCGRPGYMEEWRADPGIAAGGQLMEQGIHGIDLFRWFLGEPEKVIALTETTFWQESALEDNAFVLLHWAGGQVASMHSSLTQWRNLFSLEVFGKDGYAIVEGLGGAYGPARAVLGTRDSHASFRERVVEYRGGDRSWHEEWKEFLAAIREGREPLGSGFDGLRALQIVRTAYTSASERRAVSFSPM